jgi:Group II intron, maturase-specific domain
VRRQLLKGGTVHRLLGIGQPKSCQTEIFAERPRGHPTPRPSHPWPPIRGRRLPGQLPKTKIVYCKDENRRGKHPDTGFDFLGYCFRPRLVRRSWDGKLFWGFNPAVSDSALKGMRSAIRDLELMRKTQLSLEEIAQEINPLLRGWIGCYGRYAPSALYPLFRYVNQRLLAWVMRKQKS